MDNNRVIEYAILFPYTFTLCHRNLNLRLHTYLLQIHLVGVVPGFEKLASALLLQWHYHNIISPAKQDVGQQLLVHLKRHE